MTRKESFRKIGIIFSFILVSFSIGTLSIFFFFRLELIGDKEIKISYRDSYLEQGAKASLFGIDLSDKIKIDGKVNNGVVGDYDITYSYQLAFLSFNEVRTVHVKDLEKPVLTLKGNSVVHICPLLEYQEDGYDAYDEVDGDLTSKVERIEGVSSIKYKVFDSSGNSIVVEREIKKGDSSIPSIKLSGGGKVYLKKGDKYHEAGYSASDNCDGDLTSKVKVSGSVNSANLGTYHITYSVEDSSGNKAEVKREVVVIEETSKDDAIVGSIYLTFDDGPSNSGSTAKILDVLKQEGVHATFFVTGSGSDSLIKRMNDEGHVVALHTYTHQYQNIYASVNNYFADLERIRTRVKNITGKDVKIIRFPGGSNNTVSNKYSSGIMATLRNEVVIRGYSYFDWNVDASDAYNCAKSSVSNKKKCVYNNVTKNLSKKRSNIVLMHDVKSYTANALSDIIKYAKNRNYTFHVLTEETNPVRFK